MTSERWDTALWRVETHPRPLALAWAASCETPSIDRVFAVCVREADMAEACHYRYLELEIGVSVLPGADAAERLRTGVMSEIAHFTPPETGTGQAQWVTSGGQYGVTAPVDMPCYYFDAPLSIYFAIPDLGASLYGGGFPYFPRADDALMELLYGVTRDQGRIDIRSQIVIRLPYLRAGIRSLYYIEGQGIGVEIAENQPGGVADHELHIAWKLDDADRRLSREVLQSFTSGRLVVELEADPAYVSAALLDEHDRLVDSAERYRPIELAAPSVPLHASALPEALDFLASVWKVSFGERLFILRNTTIAAALAVPCATRSDFESRLSSVDAVLKSMTIPDILLAPSDRDAIEPTHTLKRMRSALTTRMSGADLESAFKAVDIFSEVNRLRVALQHPEAKPDLPTALSWFGVGYPPDWPTTWDSVRARLIGASIQLRDALL
jgi:hypothetical protein